MAGTDLTIALDIQVPAPRVYALKAGQVIRLITASSSTAKLQTSPNGVVWTDWVFGTVAASTTKAQLLLGNTYVRAIPVTGTATFETDLPAANALGAMVIGGVGDPTSVVDAPRGTLFLRTDGSTSTTLYVKTGDLVANWTAK